MECLQILESAKLKYFNNFEFTLAGSQKWPELTNMKDREEVREENDWILNILVF